MTKFSDNQIFDGIRKFQKDNRLKADGVMKPSGETESFFNKLLQKGEYLSSAAQQGLSLGYKAGNQLYGRGSSRSIERAVISEVLNEFGHEAFDSVTDRKRK